jgi:hypothetical protein
MKFSIESVERKGAEGTLREFFGQLDRYRDIAQVFGFQCVGLAASLSNSETETLRCLWLAREPPLPLTSGDKIYSAWLAQASSWPPAYR